MPVTVRGEIRRLDQDDFGKLAFDLMEHVFQIHNELGRFFDEGVYQAALAARIPGSAREVPIEVRHADFCKTYFIDLVVAGSGIFELKTADRLHPQHRAQVLNYLLLTDCSHAKLINLRPERVEHEFVNTTLTLADRTQFQLDAARWQELGPNDMALRPWLEAALRDWGTGLDQQFYEDATIHFFGGPVRTQAAVNVVVDGRSVARQPLRLAYPNVGLKITTLEPTNLTYFADESLRFLRHTPLSAIQWVNIHRDLVTFRTLSRGT